MATRRAAPAKAAAPKSPARTSPVPRPTKTALQAAKPAPKPAAKPMAKAAAATRPKVDKPKKPKLVRDSFTIPKAEYAVLDQLKQRAAKLGSPAKKSELLRAGLKAIAALGDPAFIAALGAVPALKTGRPAKP